MTTWSFEIVFSLCVLESKNFSPFASKVNFNSSSQTASRSTSESILTPPASKYPLEKRYTVSVPLTLHPANTLFLGVDKTVTLGKLR